MWSVSQGKTAWSAAQIASVLEFIVWTVFVSIGAIVLSIALGFSVEPDATIFFSP